MKAAHVLQYGDTDPSITISEAHPRPIFEKAQGTILVKVLACSIAAGDVHMISGRVSYVLSPPSFPFIPGKDICGIVVEADETSKFQKGDYVVYSGGAFPIGGMAEYMLIKESVAAKKPENVDILAAASCPDSAVTAWMATQAAKIKHGESVLVLGGSGGVGSVAVQLMRDAGASLVASTSSQTDMLKRLGVDKCINYHNENWWEIPEFQQNRFDVLVDCVGGNDHYTKSCNVLKSSWNGGRFVAVVGDEPLPIAKNLFQLLGFACRFLWKPIWTLFTPWKPKYIPIFSQTTTENLTDVLQRISKGSLTIALDPSSPFPFTSEGVTNAFKLQASGRAHGKVVVQISAP